MTQNHDLLSRNFYELNFGTPKPGVRNQVSLQKKRKVTYQTMAMQHIQTMEIFLHCVIMQESSLPIPGPVFPIHRYPLHLRHIQQLPKQLKVDYPVYFHSEDQLVQVMTNFYCQISMNSIVVCMTDNLKSTCPKPYICRYWNV